MDSLEAEADRRVADDDRGSVPWVRAAGRRFGMRAGVVIGIMACGMALAPMSLASADKTEDGRPSPSTPIIRGADRGSTLAGGSEVRAGTKLPDGNGIYVVVEGGNTSAGAPITIKDGNATSLTPIGASTLCGTDAMNKGNQGRASKVVDCSSDFNPYN